MANNTFQIKRSLTPGNVPSSSLIKQGELAINIPDRRLFTKDESNTVIDVFGQSVNTTANVQFRNAVFTGNLSIAGTTSFTGNVTSSNTITGSQIISTVTNGTAPLQVTSNTLVANLNANYLSGQPGTYYSNLQNTTNILSMNRGGSNSNLVPVAGGIVYSNTQGISITVAGTTGQYLVSNGTSTPVWKNPADLSVGYAWTVNNGVYTTGSYSDPAWITSLSAAKVGLGNVTNESKATMFASPTFTGTVTSTGSVTIGGDLTVQGTQFIVSTNNSSYTAGVLSLHKPATGWITSNDGQDIGIVYENYDPSPDYLVVTGGSANGSVATLQVPRGGAYYPGAWITIDNVVPSEFNGSFKVTATTSNTFSFALASSNTVVTTGQLGRSTRITEFAITSGSTVNGSKISTINYTSPVLSLTAGDVITIYGCTPAGYNGTWTILTADVGTFTFQNTANLTDITTGGMVVIGNRKAFSGWSNDEKAFEFYRIGALNPNGKFAGIYGRIKGGGFHAAHAPAVSNTDLQTGISFTTADVADPEIWDVSTANNGTLDQVKVVSIGSMILGSTAANVRYTNAASLYIAGAPSNNHSVTITNPYAIQVASGKSLFGGNVQTYGVLTANDVLVQGNLTVQGTTTYINSQQLNVGDNIITLNADLGAVAPTENAGIEVNRGSAANVQFIWDESVDRWSLGNTSVSGTLTVSGTSNFSGVITGSITSANNSDYLDGQHGAFYQDANNLNAGTIPAARLPQANATSNGAVLILDSVTNTSVAVYAASANSVKTAYDAAIAANTFAASKVSKAGDTITGALVISNTLSVSDTTVTGFVNATAGVNTSVLSVDTSFIANTTGVYHVGVMNAATFAVGTSVIANSSGIVPASNSVGRIFGATTNRWIVYANTGNFSGAVTISNSLGSGNTTVTGWANVTSNLQVGGTLNAADVIVSGNLTVSGTTTYINSTQLNIGDNLIVLNADVTAAPTEDAGIIVNRGTSANVEFSWSETDDHWNIGNTHITGTLTANSGSFVNFGDGAFYVNTTSKFVGIDNAVPNAPLTIGSGGTNFTNPIIQFSGNANSWIQLNGQNANTGNNASSDLMLIADNGSDTSYFIDVGINSSTYNQTAYGLMKPNAGYVFVNGGDLTVGTQTNHDILFHTGNTTANSVKAGVYSNGNVGIANSTPGDKLAVQGYIYASEGIKIGDDVIRSIGNLDAATYTGGNLDLSSQEPAPTGLAIDEVNGLYCYAVGTTNKTVYQYNLASAFNLSTASYASKSLSVAAQDTSPSSIFFKPDGTKMFMLGDTNNSVFEYNLGTAWNISTATFVQAKSLVAQTSSPQGVSFSDDGENLYIAGESSVYRYTLSSAWNVATATFVSALDVSAYETTPNSVDIENNGYMLVVSGSGSNQLIQYNLAVPYDITSATYFTRLDVSQIADLDCHALQESRGSLTGQFAYVMFGDKARVFGLTTTSPAAALQGSRFIADADIHMRGHMAVYERTKFSKGIDSYGNSTVYNLRANNATITNGLVANTLTADINLGHQQTTGVVIIGGVTQTGSINLGRSTANQSIDIANGAVTSGNKKLINVGTGGVAGSNTTITIGSPAGTGSTILTQLTSIANNLTVSGTANVGGALNVTGVINRNPVVTTTLTGDLTGSSSATLTNIGSNTITISTLLSNTAVTPGTYGNTTFTPIVTVDSKGRVTNVYTVASASVGVSDFLYTASNNTFKIVTTTGELLASFDTVNALSVSSTLTVAANANFDSGTLFVDTVNNRVGINNTAPTKALTVTGEASISANATVGGKLSHTGLVPTTGTDIDQIYSVTDSLTLSTSWQDTSVNAAELATGTYVVQVLASDSAVGGGQINEYYSGIMSWYQQSSNSTVADEIALHRAGAGPSSGTVFLRVQRTLEADVADLKLQIAGTTTNSGASNYTFKFRRMI